MKKIYWSSKKEMESWNWNKNYSLFSKVMMKRKEGAEGILVFFGYEYVNWNGRTVMENINTLK